MVDADQEPAIGGRYLEVDVDRREAARYGLTMRDVQNTIKTSVGGMTVTETVEGRERYGVNVRYARELRDDADELRDDAEKIARVLVPTPTGAQVPLGQLASIRFAGGPPMIESGNAQLNSIVYVDARARTSAGAQDGDMEQMEGMPGMETAAHGQGGAMAAPTEDPMRAHLDRMAALPADSLVAVLPEHRQMVANMLARMNREMSAMNMPADTAWSATVDSIRGDLTAMPGMDAPSLAAIMPSHRGRVERLMAMHADMMRAMGM